MELLCKLVAGMILGSAIILVVRRWRRPPDNLDDCVTLIGTIPPGKEDDPNA